MKKKQKLNIAIIGLGNIGSYLYKYLQTHKKILSKKNKSKIISLTAYSKSIAKILDNYCDIVLVGDSMANVLYALENTNKITLENIIQHTLSVKKGIKKSLLVVDMPKGSYDNTKKTLQNAKLIMNSTGCDAVKLENNKQNYKFIEVLVKNNIPVMGHIGYTPQFKNKFKIEGDTKKKSRKITKGGFINRKSRSIFNCTRMHNPTSL